jgi:methylated-DNA-[protein]-cysteine S-methyltransferase
MINSEVVYGFVRNIAVGKVTTYKVLASACGNPKASRAIGNILNKNPNLVEVPCHRVIRSDGSVGGYALGTEKKIRLLQKEGVEIYAGKVRKQYILPKL